MRIERIPDPRVREEIYRAVLPNGLTVVVDRKHGFRRKFAVLATRYGSADVRYRDGSDEISELPLGIAHFLEHKLFERKGGDAADVFAAQGAMSNAATSYRTTFYHFSCTERFDENLKTLVGFVGEPYFTEKAVDKERGIIEQEIGMVKDQPDAQLIQNLLKALYLNHPIRNDILGTQDSIARIDRHILFRCFDSFYHPRNMVLIATGDLEPERTIETAHEACHGWRAVRGDPGVPLVGNEPAAVAQRSISVQMAVSRPKVAVGFKDEPLGRAGRDLLRRQIHTNMALDLVLGPASPEYTTLYEKGVIDDTFHAGFTSEPDFGFTIIACDTTRPDAFRRAIRGALDRARSTGFTNEDVNRARRKALGNYLRALNSTEHTALALMWSHFKGILLSDYMSEVQRVTRHDLEARLAEHLVYQRSAFSVVSRNGPRVRAPAKAKAKASGKARPKAKAAGPAKPKARAKPAAVAKAAGRSKSKAKPTGRPKVKAASRPKAKATARPKAKPRPKAKATATARPKAKPRPKAKATARPKAKPRPRAKAKPKARPKAKPRPRAKAKPKARPRPKAAGQSRPKKKKVRKKR